MKKNLILMAFAIVSAFLVFSCDDEQTGGKLDQDANIYINGRNSVNKSVSTTNTDGTQKRLTVEEICKGDSIVLCATSYDKEGNDHKIFEEKFIYNGSIDTIKNRIALRAGNINGLEKNEFLMEEWKWYIRKLNWIYNGEDENGDTVYVGSLDINAHDTIAYIPTGQRLAVVDTLTTLFEDKEGNWDKIYKIFNDAFIFYPCTGEEYKELEAAGLN